MSSEQPTPATPKNMEDFSENRFVRFANKVSLFFSDLTFGVIDPWLDRIYYHMEVGQLNRRLALYTGFGVMLYGTFWSFKYADSHSGNEVALVVAAILVPANAFAAALFKYYNDGKMPTDFGNIASGAVKARKTAAEASKDTE